MSLINKALEDLDKQGERLKKRATKYNAKIIEQIINEEKQAVKRLLITDKN